MPAVEFVPTGQPTGVEIRGLSLRDVPDPSTAALLKLELARHGVLVFPDQGEIDEEQQLAFTSAFGEVIGHPLPGVGGLNPTADANPNVFYLSNASEGHNAKGAHRREVTRNADGRGSVDNSRARGELGWHTDLQYMPEPQVYSLLYGVEIPDGGGETEWANLSLAYEALDGETKQLIAPLKAITWYSRRIPPVNHPLVRRNPTSGSEALYVSTLSRLIDGWGQEEGKALIARLTEHVTDSRFCYLHTWRKGDAVMWDNRCTLHRRRAFDTSRVRIVRRTQTSGEPVIAA